jgi:hypothetical protein
MHPALLALMYQQLAGRKGLSALALEQQRADEAVPAGETSPATPEPVVVASGDGVFIHDPTLYAINADARDAGNFFDGIPPVKRGPGRPRKAA